jgi:hypothetical protein
MIHGTQWRAHVERMEDNIVLASNAVRDLWGGGENETLGDLKESGHINGETCSRPYIEAQTLSIQKVKRRRKKRIKTKNAILLRKDTKQPTDSNLVLCSVLNSIVEMRLQGSSPHVCL